MVKQLIQIRHIDPPRNNLHLVQHQQGSSERLRSSLSIVESILTGLSVNAFLLSTIISTHGTIASKEVNDQGSVLSSKRTTGHTRHRSNAKTSNKSSNAYLHYGVHCGHLYHDTDSEDPSPDDDSRSATKAVSCECLSKGTTNIRLNNSDQLRHRKEKLTQKYCKMAIREEGHFETTGNQPTQRTKETL